MCANFLIAAVIGVIAKKRVLLFVTVAVGGLLFAAASSFGQSSVSTLPPDPSLYDADLMASVSNSSGSTQFYFEWGLTTNYGHETHPIFLQGANIWSVSNFIFGLAPYTTYHFQALAISAFGQALGGDVSFTTVPKFVQVGTNTGWDSFALSADGQELVASESNVVYISTNLGVSFSSTAMPGSVFAVSSNETTILSSDGDTNIYVSLDRGLTWITNTISTNFAHIATSSDSQTIIATSAGFNGYAYGKIDVYSSTNFGATWSQTSISAPDDGLTGTGNVACSADASQIYIAGTGYTGEEAYWGLVFASGNSGYTWSTPFDAFDVSVSSFACSANGSIVAVTGQAGYISTNGGASWNGNSLANEEFDNSISIACSSDGQTMITDSYGSLYVSPNTGITWYLANLSAYLENAEFGLSADGKSLAVFVNGAIYLALPQPSEPSALSVTTISSNGVPSFQLAGEAGYTYIVQASTDLLSWTNVATIVNSNGRSFFTDQASSNDGQRFYRAIVP